MKPKRHRRKRKCLHCRQLYTPDPRTADRQKHCSALACQRASKAWRQRRWRNQPENRDYFRGPHHVARVQEWRKMHPGYWRKGSKSPVALQDDCPSQFVAPKQHDSDLAGLALQDDCWLQPPLVVGLIAQLTGSALQDDIAMTIRRMQACGQKILGMGPGIKSKGDCDDRQTPVVSTAAPAHS